MNQKLNLSALLLAIAAAAPVQAADWYLGGSLGASDWKIDAQPGESWDRKDTGYKLFLGAGLHPNFAIEGGYVNLGKAKGSGTDAVFGAITAESKSYGYFADAVGIVPLSPSFSLFGKVGVLNAHSKLSGTTSTPVASASESYTSTNVRYGVGVSYAFSKAFGVRAEWERNRLKIADEKGDVDLLSLGVTFGF